MTTTHTPDAGPSDRRTPGDDGIWVLLLGDMAVFALFFVTFMVERSKAPDEFDMARRTLHAGIGLTNTFALLTSSLLIVVAVAAVRAGMQQAASRAVIAAIGCGLVFVALKCYEYSSLLNTGLGGRASDFYLYYFVLTGIHLLHVCLGLAVLAALWTQTQGDGLSIKRRAHFESGACFWHLVDMLWIMLFPLLYMVS